MQERDDELELAPGPLDATTVLPQEETTTNPELAADRSAALLGVELHQEYGHDHDPEHGEDLEANDKPGAKVFKSPRFMGDVTLEKVATGTATLKKGDAGLAVSRLQQGLIDAGHAPATGRTGTFDDATVAAVKAFQTAKSVKASGDLDQQTLTALDRVFADHSVDATIAKGKKPPGKPALGVEYVHGKAPKELLVGTTKPSATEAVEADAVLAPVSAIDKTTGKPVIFEEDIKGKGKYGARLKVAINTIVDRQYAQMAKGKAAAHADPTQLHDLGDVEQVAKGSKAQTDGVFGNYAVGPAFDKTNNLRDRWAVQAKEIQDLQDVSKKGGAAGAAADKELAGIARWRVQKIVNSNKDINTINAEHGAVVSRPAEKAIVAAVVEDIAKARASELREIHKGWSASADPNTREVFLQLFKSSDAAENRQFMWRTFQTLVHEYIHTLNHSRFRAYSQKLSGTEPAKSHALREGATEYLTKVVLSTVNYGDKGLRKQVEGPYHDPTVAEPAPVYGGYAQAVEAEQVAGLVGASNFFAAYFLGDIELIGGKP